jgi:all-trans-retinol 13,14-reductase
LIGSGISSLTCAVLLAKAGRKVLVVERYEKPGGYLHCFERYGHRFDTGAHYSGALGEGQPFRVLLEHLGVYDDELFTPLAADGFDVFRFSDFEVTIPWGYEPLIASLSEQFPAEAVGIRRFFEQIEQAARSFSTYNFAKLSQNDDEIAALLSTSLEAVVQTHTRDPRLQCVLYGYCALHGVSPADVSLGMHALLTDSLVRGAWGFKNGGQRLAERYCEAVERHGGEVLRGVGVAELRTDGKRVSEVVLDDGTAHSAPVVVSGIHPKATFRLLRDFRLSPAFAARLEGIEETLAMMGIYGVCSEPPPFARDRNYYFFDWSEPEAFGRLRGGDRLRGAIPMAAFVCRPDRDAAATPDTGSYPVSVHTPAPYEWFSEWADRVPGRKPRAYYLRKLEAAEASLSFVDRYVPGFKRQLVRYDVSTPLSNLRYNGSEQGSAYGIYHSMRNTGARSIGPRTHVENLLLTGQSSLFPGLLGAAISGLRTAGNLVGIKNILKDLGPMVTL